jgi:hypothetical protein
MVSDCTLNYNSCTPMCSAIWVRNVVDFVVWYIKHFSSVSLILMQYLYCVFVGSFAVLVCDLTACWHSRVQFVANFHYWAILFIRVLSMFNTMLFWLISWLNIALNSFNKVESYSDMLGDRRFCESIWE